MKPISQRKKKVPSVKGMPINVKDVSEQDQKETFRRLNEEEKLPLFPLLPHHERRRELSKLYGIPEKDIFVDPGNGVELYRTSTGGWAYAPGY